LESSLRQASADPLEEERINMVVDGDGMKKKNQPKNIVDSRKLPPRVTLELVEGKDILKQEKKKDEEGKRPCKKEKSKTRNKDY
jgi:hypothetical protein